MAVPKVGLCFAAMHNLSKADIAVLQEKFTVLPRSLEILREQNSSDGMTSQAALGLAGRQFGRNCSDAP